jgi:hypothetical protein
MKKKDRLCGAERPSDRRTTCQRDVDHRGDHRAKVATWGGRSKVYGWRS